MKKIFLGFLIGAFLCAPLWVFSAPSLSSKLQGKILLDVNDKGKTFFVHSDGKRYRITKDTALEIFRKLALGITTDNLSQIPEGSVGIDPEKALATETATTATCEPVVNATCPVCATCSNTSSTCEPKIVYVDKIIEKTNYVEKNCSLGTVSTTTTVKEVQLPGVLTMEMDFGDSEIASDRTVNYTTDLIKIGRLKITVINELMKYNNFLLENVGTARENVLKSFFLCYDPSYFHTCFAMSDMVTTSDNRNIGETSFSFDHKDGIGKDMTRYVYLVAKLKADASPSDYEGKTISFKVLDKINLERTSFFGAITGSIVYPETPAITTKTVTIGSN